MWYLESFECLRKSKFPSDKVIQGAVKCIVFKKNHEYMVRVPSVTLLETAAVARYATVNF
jgi:hypothetical protein